MTKAQRKRERQSGRRARHGSLEMISDGDALTNRTKPTEEGGSERPRMPPHAGRIGRSQTSPFPMNVVHGGCSVHNATYL